MFGRSRLVLLSSSLSLEDCLAVAEDAWNHCPYSLKQRGAVKASLTRLVPRVDSIERALDFDEARRLTTRLESVVAEFKVHHYSVIDLLDDEDEDGIQEQQTVLDEHEDIVAQLTARLWLPLQQWTQGSIQASQIYDVMSSHYFMRANILIMSSWFLMSWGPISASASADWLEPLFVYIIFIGKSVNHNTKSAVRTYKSPKNNYNLAYH